MDISIIIPTYNRLWSLPDTIRSCRSNKYKIEIIVIDDGSEDGTWEWLKLQENIISIKQENWGKCWAVNKGFEITKGKYIRFLDSDDLLNEGAVDEQFELAECENSDVVVSGYQVINEKGELIREQKWIFCDDFISQQLGECDSSHYSAYLFRKEFILNIPHRPDYAFRDDRLFILEVAIKEPKVSIHNGCALKHREHTNIRLQKQTGIKTEIQNFQHFVLYKKIYTLLSQKNMLTERRIKAISKIMWPLARWVAVYNLSEAKNILHWIKEIDQNFVIPEKKIVVFLYSFFGFANFESMLRIKRLVRFNKIYGNK